MWRIRIASESEINEVIKKILYTWNVIISCYQRFIIEKSISIHDGKDAKRLSYHRLRISM